ncbi:hypothetical protein [Natronorubrum sp. FCH18a]
MTILDAAFLIDYFDGWRLDAGYPADRNEATEQSQPEQAVAEAAN